MRFLLDESADLRLAGFLSNLGHDVTTVAHDHPGARTDREVLALARRQHRVLITNDLDFGDLIIRERLPHRGVILFRLRSTSLAAKQARLDFVLERYAAQLDTFLTMTEARVRSQPPAARSG